MRSAAALSSGSFATSRPAIVCPPSKSSRVPAPLRHRHASARRLPGRGAQPAIRAVAETTKSPSDSASPSNTVTIDNTSDPSLTVIVLQGVNRPGARRSNVLIHLFFPLPRTAGARHRLSDAASLRTTRPA